MRILITLFFISWAGLALGQPPQQDPPNGAQPNPNKWDNSNYNWSWEQQPQITFTPVPPTPVPVDGGIGFLIAASLGYGVHRFRKAKKQ